MTRQFALEWREHGIRVCGVAPGPIRDTEGMSRLLPSAAGVDPNSVPMGDKDDIAFAVIYLAVSPYVSGTTLVVDGAAWLQSIPLIPRNVYEGLRKKQTSKL